MPPSDIAQTWTVRFHWKSEYSDGSGFLVYYHIMPANDVNDCLQQDQDSGPGTALGFKPCGGNWLQQWVVAPEG